MLWTAEWQNYTLRHWGITLDPDNITTSYTTHAAKFTMKASWMHIIILAPQNLLLNLMQYDFFSSRMKD